MSETKKKKTQSKCLLSITVFTPDKIHTSYQRQVIFTATCCCKYWQYLKWLKTCYLWLKHILWQAVTFKTTNSWFFIYLFRVLHRFQHCTGHITTGSWKGRGNQYIQFVRVLYCKLPTNGKQLPAFPLEAVPGTVPWPQRWEARIN